MYYNSVPYYPQNMYSANVRNLNRQPGPPMGGRPPRPGNNPGRFGGGFLLPFALGFVSSPLIFGATRPRPIYGPYPPYPYYPYY